MFVITLRSRDRHDDNEQGYSSLHDAVNTENYLLAKNLLKNVSLVDIRTKNGNTALSLAINGQLSDMVEILLQHNADLKNDGNDGKSAL